MYYGLEASYGRRPKRRRVKLGLVLKLTLAVAATGLWFTAVWKLGMLIPIGVS